MILSIIKNLFNVLQINLKIFLAKYKKKKVIFFYHPKEKITLIHNYYIEYIFKNYSSKEYCVFYGHKMDINLGKNYFNIKEGYVKFLSGIDFFINNNICDVFPKNCNKIYIHHNLYDDPWVARNKENEMCQRLLRYDYILVATTWTLKRINETFLKYNFIKKPKIIEVGYAKLDYLLSNLRDRKIKKESILIAPTRIDGAPGLSIIDNLKNIIQELLSKTEYNIILRPHPNDTKHKTYIYLKNEFIHNKRFYYDLSNNYFDIYTKSKLMITDLSGTAYTFAFLCLSPVIFLSINEKKINEDEYSNYNFFLDRKKIGEIIFDEIHIIDKIKLISNNYNLYEKAIIQLRKNMKYLNRATIEIKKIIDN